jgi:hypothetical protein
LDKDFKAWHEVEIIKLKEKKAAQVKMDPAQKEANELMQQALKGDKSALADVKNHLKGARGKKKGKLSDFDACILEGWRDPNGKSAARNAAKRCKWLGLNKDSGSVSAGSSDS